MRWQTRLSSGMVFDVAVYLYCFLMHINSFPTWYTNGRINSFPLPSVFVCLFSPIDYVFRWFLCLGSMQFLSEENFQTSTTRTKFVLYSLLKIFEINMFSSRPGGSLWSSWDAKWSCSNILLLYDLSSYIYHSQVNTITIAIDFHGCFPRSQMPGTPRIRSMRNRFLVAGQLIVATIVAYSRYET